MSHPEDPQDDRDQGERPEPAEASPESAETSPEPAEGGAPEAEDRPEPRVDPRSWDFPLRSQQEAEEEEARVRTEAEALLQQTEGDDLLPRRRVGDDPLSAARAALEAAARARGEEPDLTSVSRERLSTRQDPLRAAQEALERAAEARKLAQQGGPKAAARQAQAKMQLEVLRRRLGQLSQPGRGLGPADEEEEEAPKQPQTGPRKRRL